MLVLTNAQPHHPAELLAKPLHQQNAASWSLSSGGKPIAETLPAALQGSVLQRALLNAAGECVCLWGVVMVEGFGNFWMLAAEEAAGQFERPQEAWHEEVATMLRLFGSIFAFSHRDSPEPGIWLENLGFKQFTSPTCDVATFPFIGYVKELPKCALH